MPYNYQKPKNTYGGYKKPVKSFQDLEVYQKSLEISVFVAKKLLPRINVGGKEISNLPAGRQGSPNCLSSNKKEEKTENTLDPLVKPEDDSISKKLCRGRIFKCLLVYSLGLPHLIAEAHSVRFGDKEESIVLLEKVMLNCNKLVVYLEQTRDICETGIEWEVFDEQIKKIFDIRRKVLHLQMSWKKYMELDK